MVDYLRKSKSFKDLLFSLDEYYFLEVDIDNEEDFVCCIAAWIYDQDETQWESILQIRQICGDRIVWAVIEGLYERNHDT